MERKQRNTSHHDGQEAERNSSHNGGQETEWISNWKKPEQDIVPKDIPPLIYLHHQAPPSTVLPLPIVYSNFKSISVLNHSLNQNPHDLIISAKTLTDTPRDVLY
jgi:hypothetical protein